MKTTAAPLSRCFLLLALLSCAIVSPAFAAPFGLGFKGTLEDGGLFIGSILYSDQDMEGVSQSNPDGVPDFGRFLGGLWQVDVDGGSTTVGARLAGTIGCITAVCGRAVIETYLAANLIGVYTLGPLGGELPRLSLMFESRAGYDPDVQPTSNDIVNFFFTLSTAVSGYRDSNGVFTRIATIDIRDTTADFTPVPVPGGLGLMAGALGVLAPALKRRTARRAI